MLDSSRFAHLIGSPLLPQRFWDKVDIQPDGCWLWTAGRTGGNYAYLWAKQGTTRAHRLAYEALVEQVPKTMDLDHLCRVRHCVNPAHLEPVTRRENMRRGEIPYAHVMGRTHCPEGHPLIYSEKEKRRRCPPCRTEQMRTYRARAAA